jgi:hypothetical protein
VKQKLFYCYHKSPKMFWRLHGDTWGEIKARKIEKCDEVSYI